MDEPRAHPYAVREIEHAWIPMPDGTRLAARMWLPWDAGPRPAIVEYIPYRKRWGTRHRDEPMHRYFAGHGYAIVRIDVRGSGESEGLLADEYSEAELADGIAAFGWIARQRWCDGRIGMIGKSWGGFIALQLAALAPPELRAVVAVCASDDRYGCDAHYAGGCLLAENAVWGSMLFATSALPPDPALVGGAWRERWRARLEALPLFAKTWMEHPLRDDYWRRGSASEALARIRCPVLLAGGWADGYARAVPRLVAALGGPRRGVVGPWGHQYPHEGIPGPARDFLPEVLAWWDEWLAERRPRTRGRPALAVYVQDGTRPNASAAFRPGRWVELPTWPAAHASRAISLAHDAALAVPFDLAVGRAAGAWCSFGFAGDQPGDQREDDARSLCLDVDASGLEVVGAPELRVVLTCDRPWGQLVARLCDVAPDGASVRIAYGVLDLTHGDDHTRRVPLVPGVSRTWTLRLDDCAHRFAPGHRVRVALSATYWPIVWPTARAFGLVAHEVELRLPVHEDLADTEETSDLASAVDAGGAIDPAGSTRRSAWDAERHEWVDRVEIDRALDGTPAMAVLSEIDLAYGHAMVEESRIDPRDPASARAAFRHEIVARRTGWEVRVVAAHALSTVDGDFRLEAELAAWDGKRRVFARTWDERIRRE